MGGQLSYRLQRHSRVDPVFDRWEQMLSLGWGNILKYTYKLKQFDDSMTRREDFQLVSFYQHQFNFHLRLKLWQMLLARLSYQLAFQGYEDNLNVLVRSVAELKKAGTRLDQHHQLSFRVPYLVTNQLIIQPEVAYQRNRGNVPFYHFSISKGRLVTFYRFQEKRLVQLMTAWRKL